MISKSDEIIGKYLREKDTVFTSEDLCSYLKENGIRLPIEQIEDVLNASDYVFTLVNHQYVTRAGAFTGRAFSFKPSREEIEKGAFLIGHRCIPFSNPEVEPDSITVVSNGKIVQIKNTEFSMNLALDTFAIFGEGFSIPAIVNDRGNKDVALSDIKYGMPASICLTSWPFKSIKGGNNIEYGDRILCKVLDWQNAFVDVKVLKENHEELIVSQELIEREQWYSDFENSLLESFERHGPCNSIEDQLSFLFLENQESLCKISCGSIEEFISHTTKIGFQPYGVETRIWRVGETVPYVGTWNINNEKERMLVDLSFVLAPEVVDSFIKNDIYEERTNKSFVEHNHLLQEVIQKLLARLPNQQNSLLLNIEKRRDIIKNNYNPFADYSIGDIRKRSLTLFSNVCSLFSSIACGMGKLGDFPQQELVILIQLYGHLLQLVEEFGYFENSSSFPIDDLSLSLDGMEDTFDEVGPILKGALEANKSKGFEIISDEP